MHIQGIKTHKITQSDTDILFVLDRYLENVKIPEKSVLAITSKIVSITEGAVASLEANKDDLIVQEAQYFLPRDSNKYDVSFTITHNMLVPTAGIDESNANGNYILWPKDPQASANRIREHITTRGKLQEFGVIITDSRTVPLRWGVTATTIAYSGFVPLKDYIGTPDLFGRKFAFEKLNIADSLAAAAGAVMGEGAEQTPLALISEIPHIQFVSHNPREEELKSLIIAKEDDLYAPFLTAASWQKGKK